MEPLMTPGEITIIQRSFEQIARIRLDAGQMFYERLFLIAPELRPLFSTDIRVQASKLMDTLAFVIGQLPDGPDLVPTLQRLGQRHLAYGVKPEHYDQVGEALLWTIEKVLGGEWTHELRAAWIALYDRAATVMKDAAYSNVA
jgi:hemoglobin-like flavoprotein